MTGKLLFIVIDDNKLNIFVAEKMIKNLDQDSSIHVETFNYANNAFDYLKEGHQFEKTIILIDINMPLMTGFEFIESYEKTPEAFREHCYLYVYTSSINENDKIRASNYRAVRQFFSKPLTYNTLNTILEDVRNS